MAGCGMKKKMAKGGMSLFKGKDTKKEEMKEAKAVKSGKLTPKQYAKGEMKEEKLMKKEGRGMAKADMQKEMNPGMKKLKEKAPEIAAKMGYKKSGAMKKGYHKMPDGEMMKDSEHKGIKKMAKGGSVKKGADGVATKGKTKGKFV